jgi:hypothetical protein
VAGGSWILYFALLGLVLAYGAAITSLGLAMATWVSRIGRAVTLCIAINVVGMVGWPFVIALCVGTPAMRYVGMMIGDPPAGMLLGTFAVLLTNVPRAPGGPDFDAFWLPMIAWIIVISGLAALLFAATAATFDCCLGRASDGTRPPSSRPGRSSLSPDELLALVPSAFEEGYDEEEEEYLPP